MSPPCNTTSPPPAYQEHDFADPEPLGHPNTITESIPPSERTPLKSATSACNVHHDRVWTCFFTFMITLLVVLLFESTTYVNPKIQAIIRKKWSLEVEEHVILQKKWAKDRAGLDEAKRDWRRKLEEQVREERRRLNIRFEVPHPNAHCNSYGKRVYSAQLLNIGHSMDSVLRVSACRETAVEIHGTSVSPAYCQDMDESGGIRGFWVVDDATCSPQYTRFEDKGCTAVGSRTRAYHGYLDGLQHGDDWRVMCSTTPASMFGHHFNSPIRCDWFGPFEIWGIWEVPDSDC